MGGAARLVDLRGLECPEPLLRALRVILSMLPGETAVFLVDSEACADNIALAASQLGRARVARRSGYFEVRVARGLTV